MSTSSLSEESVVAQPLPRRSVTDDASNSHFPTCLTFVENLSSKLVLAKDLETGTVDNLCSICHSDYSKDDEVIELNDCKHVYHKECLLKWLRMKSTCPVCRFQLPVCGWSVGTEEDHLSVSSITDDSIYFFCDSCALPVGEGRAHYVCVDCDDRFCTDCIDLALDTSHAEEHTLHFHSSSSHSQHFDS